MNMTHVTRVFGERMRLWPIGLVAAVLASGFTSEATGTAVAPPAAMASFGPGGADAPGLMVAASSHDERISEVRSTFDVESWADSEVGRMDRSVLRLALRASQCAIAAGAVKAPATLTVIDYSKASVEPRLWVLDLRSRALLYEELVSHGQGSGANMATRFSNTPESHQTSIGLFVTDQPYVGRNGYSLRLDGLDEGFNDRARERAIVMHGASYVNAAITKSLGRLGRSHGCPAVRDAVAPELIDRVKGGSLVFAYYPDAEWLRSSKFLGNCGT